MTFRYIAELSAISYLLSVSSRHKYISSIVYFLVLPFAKINSFSVMMAASGAANKEEEAIQIKPVVIKRKVGRPPAAKQAAPVIDPFR